MFFLTPRHIKEGRHYRHALKRLIHYKEDILAPDELTRLKSLVGKMTEAIKSRRREQIHSVREEIEKEVGKIAPPAKDAGWRENVEVFLVAIVVAAGVRAYFLQPFKIPTGSMQPTLFGVVGFQTDTPPPNPLTRAFQFIWLGRSYFNVTARQDETILDLRESTQLNFFTFTDVVTRNRTYKVFAPVATLVQYFGVRPGREYRAGDPIVRGYVDTGDQVFVDKMSYNFVNPALGDVFVFKTTGIRGIRMEPGIESQHYIKRLAGVPGTTLRIASPLLYLNGQVAVLPPFQRVMSEKNGYNGYSNMASLYLFDPEQTFTVTKHAYFALGDNSYHSSDSRFWGEVPEKNVAGRGLFVYWPFSSRWGLIR